MYNEIYPCISEPKTKVHVDERSVYQLLSNMRVGKKDNILKLLVTEKTHATLKRKKYFPMFLNHIDFLTKRAGWRVTKVYSNCTFELEPFKKDYILSNQIARQEAVARADDVQANFWKLLNNANFGFDCRNNSQNKRLHLIYNEQAEIEFINKYEGYESTNCFLNLENIIENVCKKYTNIEGLPEENQPFAQSLMKEEIEKSQKSLVRKRKVNKRVSLKTVSRRRTVTNRILLIKIKRRRC